jgi:hypothetical protein
MLALYNGTMHLTARNVADAGKQSLVHHYRGAIAGAVSGVAMVVGPQDRETKKTLALFMFIRAVEVEARIWVEKGWLPCIGNCDVLLMSLSSAQILWSWFFVPTANDPLYQNFLNRHGQKPRPIIDFIADICRGSPMNLGAINTLRERKGLSLIDCDPVRACILLLRSI